MAASSALNEVNGDVNEADNGERHSNSRSRTNSASNPPCWRLVLLSSKIRQASVLNNSSLSGVSICSYKFETTSLESLLVDAQQTLNGRRVNSIAFVAQGQQGTMNVCSNNEVTYLYWHECLYSYSLFCNCSFLCYHLIFTLSLQGNSCFMVLTLFSCATFTWSDIMCRIVYKFSLI